MITRCERCGLPKPCAYSHKPAKCEVHRKVKACSTFEELIQQLREIAGKYDPHELHMDLELEAADIIEKLIAKC